MGAKLGKPVEESLFSEDNRVVEVKKEEEEDDDDDDANVVPSTEEDREKTHLALLMLSGTDGVEVNQEKAVALLEERVKQGDSEAMWMLGLCYDYGIGVGMDRKQALKLYKRSFKKTNEAGTALLRLRQDSLKTGVVSTPEIIINCLLFLFVTQKSICFGVVTACFFFSQHILVGVL